MSIDNLKKKAREIGAKYPDREQRARRMFIEDKSVALEADRDREFDIKKDISGYFSIPHSNVVFCGSAQLGFSVHKDKIFTPAVSDLDVACLDINLFQRAWVDVISTTSAFSNLTSFSGGMTRKGQIEIFQQQILKRGMIRVDAMPQSELSRSWSAFQSEIGRRHAGMFNRISIAIYMNQYAFCWKQDSILSMLMG